jgi:hypothetical protein
MEPWHIQEPSSEEAPSEAPMLMFGDELSAVSAFVAAQAARHGVIGNRAALLVIAAEDVAAHLMRTGAGQATVRVWARSGTLFCRFDAPDGWHGPAPAALRHSRGLRGRIEMRSAGPVTTVSLPIRAASPRPS